MKLSELIKKTPWSSVESSLSSLFTDEEEPDLSAFKVFFETLKYDITPTVSHISLQITKNINPVSGERGYQISGVNLGSKKTRSQLKKILKKEYNSWDKWLGMEIDDETLKVISVVEIIGVCMFTMHVINKQPEAILDELENFIELFGVNKKISKEEKIGELISYKDLKNYFSLS